MDERRMLLCGIGLLPRICCGGGLYKALQKCRAVIATSGPTLQLAFDEREYK